MKEPSVSVVLAVFNGGELLRSSIESILRQSFQDFELLVVDDGSSDVTPDILRSYNDPRLRVLTNEKNLGLTRSLNRGLNEARGEFVARQDADDLSAPDRLEKQVGFLRAHPEIALLGSSAWRMNPAGKITGPNDMPVTHDVIRWASIVDSPFLHTAVMFRRELVIQQFHGYDEQFAICQDYDLWTRIAAVHRVANLPERLVSMREHPSSMTRTQSGATTDEFRRIAEAVRESVFPGRQFTSEEHELLALVRLRFPSAQLPALRKLMTELLVDFVGRNPAAKNHPDLRAVLCRQSLRLAYKFLGTDLMMAATDIARAFSHSPREWCAQAGAAVFQPPK